MILYGFFKKEPFVKKIFFLVILLIFALFIIWKISNSAETSPLITGELEKTYQVEGVIVRNETVVNSPDTGELSFLVEDGQRVRKGEKIAEVKTVTGVDLGSPGTSVAIISPGSGVVINRVDGLEGILDDNQVNILEIAKTGLGKQSAAGQDGIIKCQKGQPVMKLVDNLAPITICLQLPEDFPRKKLERGKNIAFNWEKKYYSGIISDIRIYQGSFQLLLQVNNYPESFYSRLVQIELVGDRESGYIVSVNSLVEKEGRTGIYIVKKHQQTWVPVIIEGIVDDQAAVTGEDLIVGGRYIVNPSGFK